MNESNWGFKNIDGRRADDAKRGCIPIGQGAAALLALILSSPVHASVVYSQAPSGVDTSNNSYVSSYPNGTLWEQWVFDNFTPSKGGTVTNITWQGSAQPTNPPYDTSNGFVIAIYDTLPVPDPEASATKPLVSYHIAGNANQKPSANGAYDFSYDLSKPFTLVAGQSYWMTIYATDVSPSPGMRWSWNSGAGGMPNSSAQTIIVGESYMALNTGHRAFALSDATPPSPVPAPAALWLLGSALLGLFACGHRREAR